MAVLDLCSFWPLGRYAGLCSHRNFLHVSLDTQPCFAWLALIPPGHRRLNLTRLRPVGFCSLAGERCSAWSYWAGLIPLGSSRKTLDSLILIQPVYAQLSKSRANYKPSLSHSQVDIRAKQTSAIFGEVRHHISAAGKAESGLRSQEKPRMAGQKHMKTD